MKKLRGWDLNPRPSGYEPCPALSENRRILANNLSLNNVQHEQLVPHVQRLGTQSAIF